MKNAAPALQAIRQRADEGFGLGMDFGEVVVCALDLDRRAQAGGAVDPRQARRPTPRSCQLAVPARQQLDRHGIEHLVADHHAVEPLGQLARPIAPCPPCPARASRWRSRKLAGEVDDGVAARSRSPRASSNCAASAPEPAPNSHTSSVPAGSQRVGHLHGQRLAEQRRHLRRGDEIAARRRQLAELARIVGVIAQARARTAPAP